MQLGHRNVTCSGCRVGGCERELGGRACKGRQSDCHAVSPPRIHPSARRGSLCTSVRQLAPLCRKGMPHQLWASSGQTVTLMGTKAWNGQQRMAVSRQSYMQLGQQHNKHQRLLVNGVCTQLSISADKSPRVIIIAKRDLPLQVCRFVIEFVTFTLACALNDPCAPGHCDTYLRWQVSHNRRLPSYPHEMFTQP